MSKLLLSTKSLGCLLALGVICPFGFPPMAAASITNGLVAYYPFDGNAADLSGNANHGTVLGAVLTTNRFGQGQRAYAFDGTNDYIRVPYSPTYRPTTQLTISAWVLLTSKTGSRTPLSCTENGGWNLNLGYGGDLNMKFGIYAGSTSATPGFSPDLLPEGTWHHLVGTYDGASAKIYLDGLLRSSVPVTGPIHYVNNNALIIGGEAGVGTVPATVGFFAGSIDEVRVYNRALSATEVGTLFATTPLDLTTGLVAHYRLDGNGLDSSGNGYHGTVTGATPTEGVGGEAGGAYAFGGDDYVGIQSVPLLQQLTMSAWFKVPAEGSIAPDNSMTLVGADGSYKVYLYGTNSLTLHGNSKAGSVPSGAWTGGPSYTNPVSRGVWHHVAWSRALNGHQELFLDGQLVSQGNYSTGTIPEGYGEYIGLDRMHNGTLRYFFYGSIDDVRIYNRPLSVAEVEALWDSRPADPDLTTGLLFHAPFDGDSGSTVVDVSGNGHHATASGCGLAAEPEMGLVRTFDGNSNRIDVSDESAFDAGSGAFTFGCWIRPDSAHPDYGLTLASKYYMVGQRSWVFFHMPNGGLQLDTSATSAVGYDKLANSAAGVLQSQVWQHVAFVKSGTDVRFFVNGVAVADDNAPVYATLYNSSEPLRLGNYRHEDGTIGTRHCFRGRMDDARYYARELTDADIHEWWLTTRPETPPPTPDAPILEYLFDSDNATNVIDSSDAGHDGTAMGSWLVESPIGAQGNVRAFNGSNSYIRVHDEAPFDFRSAPFSVSMWVQPAPNESGLAKALISKYFTYYQRQWAIFLEADGRLNIDTSATGQYGQDKIRRTTVAAVRPGVWQHVVVTRSGTDAQFFVDGEAVPNDGVPIYGTFLDTAEPVRIGTYRVENGAVTGHPHVYAGLMDEVRIYPRALAPEAVRDIYTNSVYAGLVELRITGEPVEAGTPAPLGYGVYTAARGVLVTNSVDALAPGPVGTRYLGAGWTGSGSVPATGSTQTAVFELNTNSVLTWQWRAQHWLDVSAYAGGTVDASNGWFDADTVLALTATPDANSQFVRWVGTLQGGASTNNPLTLTMDRPHTIAAVFRERDTVFANHWDDDGYYFPGDNIVQCRFYIEQPEDLLSLAWHPILPAGWSLVAAQGDGDPQIYGGEIVFSRQNLGNPITFTYTVCVPPGTSGARQIAGEASYMLDGMANPATLRASPDPLVLSLYPYAYHTADYQDPRWLIDAVEVSRVLAYWRAGWYKPNPAGFDGYAPTTKNYDGGTNTRHRADYKTPYWKINAPEANRVLAYWRAGGYRIDPTGEDGFAPMVHEPLTDRATRAATADSACLAVQPRASGSTTYDPGVLLSLTNVVTFDTGLLALCVRPQLPAGWSIVSVSAPGNPEVVAGEILWTGTLPASPVTVVYTVRVPVSSIGDKTVSGQVEAFVGSASNPAEAAIPATVYSMQATDADGDGLPDEWEKAYTDGTTELEPDEDDDNDGATNREEWLAGTHPRDAASVFAVSQLTVSREGEFGVAWQSAGERVYGVATAAQAAGPYSNVVSGVAATPPTNAVSPLALPPSASFIRVVLEQPQP